MKSLEHINLLGLKVVDKATNFTGVVISVSFDLYGCIQAVVQPQAAADGSLADGKWFDVNRLKQVTGERVMDVPDYDHKVIANGDHGCAEKPTR